jgi:hypothetical protein
MRVLPALGFHASCLTVCGDFQVPASEYDGHFLELHGYKKSDA